ncbi:MAG: alpha/beta hydrolase [Bacteroidia bacterium]|nr:alpha/beta hydrolase [Bacteroidia bacterium]
MKHIVLIGSLLVLGLNLRAQEGGVMEKVSHHYADNDGVKIHYVSMGEGPLAVMIHGFPDFWYSWRNQMEALSKTHKVVAVDLRGYNKSDKPEGVEAYKMVNLMKDIEAVIKAEGKKKAIIIGHDWGGAISWSLAIYRPDLVEKLIICNLPHPKGMANELANNPEQQKNSEYARKFQEADAHKKLTAEGLAAWLNDEEAKKYYIEAFKRSSFEGMLNFYKANYPKEPYQSNNAPIPKVKCSVLMIHGLDDWALLPGGLNNTWKWLEKDLTLVTVPGAGHFVQHDAPEMVSRTMLMWLNR